MRFSAETTSGLRSREQYQRYGTARGDVIADVIEPSSSATSCSNRRYYVPPLRRRGPLSDTAIRPSVCPSLCLSVCLSHAAAVHGLSSRHAFFLLTVLPFCFEL